MGPQRPSHPWYLGPVSSGSGEEVVKARGPLESALEAELERLEVLLAHVWFLAVAFGMGLSFIVAATVSFDLGMACAAVAFPYALWFFFLRWRLKRDEAPPFLVHLNAAIESSMAWVLFIALLVVQGPGYALASWVPPMVFCLTVFGLTVRLQAVSVALAGVVGAIFFLAIDLIVAQPALPPELAELIIFQVEVQLTRTLSLVGVGIMAALAVRGLRQAISRAEATAREQDLFGKYRIVKEIAKGGMAAVFEAVYCPEGGFERRVAIKRIHPHLAEQEKFVDFFRSEAAISSRLNHPNIVQVLDFGRVDGKYFLSMEYVDGMTLWALMKASPEPLPVEVVALLGLEILSGLEHAHRLARGADGRPLRVVHRDLCPQNVLLSTNGEAKITDFGVARALRDAHTDQTNTVVGHLGYISPEQAAGEAVDTRSDLFAAGVMLWELLVGDALFRRDNDAATLAALIYDPVPKASLRRPGLDPAWDDFLDRALLRDPERRFQTAGAMARALLALPGADDPDGVARLTKLVRLHRAADVADDEEAQTRLDPTVPTGRHRSLGPNGEPTQRTSAGKK